MVLTSNPAHDPPTPDPAAGAPIEPPPEQAGPSGITTPGPLTADRRAGSHDPGRRDTDRLGRLASLVAPELVLLDVDDLLAELLARAREVLDVDTAAVLLVDDSGRQLVATAASGLEEEVRQGVRIPLGHGFAGRVAAERRPVILDRVDHTNVVNPILLEAGVRSLLGVPLVASGKLLGVVHVGTLAERRFTAEDTEVLQVVADRAALATEARLSRAERAAARALQRSLLPNRFPSLVGLEVAGRYLPGDSARLGGDWYDVFPLPTGELVVAIGDAMGHGLHAAMVMGRLRSTLRGYAIESTDPAEILTRLDRKLQYFEPDEMATVLVAMFDPTFASATFSSAGHPPPVLAVGESPSSLLDLPTDTPLGAPGEHARRNTTVAIPPGALLLAYTDGLVERRGQHLDQGFARLASAVFAGTPELVCARVIEQLLDASPPADDVAVVAARRTP